MKTPTSDDERSDDEVDWQADESANDVIEYEEVVHIRKDNLLIRAIRSRGHFPLNKTDSNDILREYFASLYNGSYDATKRKRNISTIILSYT